MVAKSLRVRRDLMAGLVMVLGAATLWSTGAEASTGGDGATGESFLTGYEGRKCLAEGDGEMAKGQFLEGLTLTTEQTAAIRSLGEAYRIRFHALAERGSGTRQKLRETPPDDPGYASAVDAAAHEASLLSADGVRLVADMWSEIYGVLTPEQRQQFRNRLDSEQDRWNDWRQRHLPSGNN